MRMSELLWLKFCKHEDKEIEKMLSYYSSDDRGNWIKIGQILKSATIPSGKSTKDIWDKWSKKSDKFNQSDNDHKWNHFRINHDKGNRMDDLFMGAFRIGYEKSYFSPGVQEGKV